MAHEANWLTYGYSGLGGVWMPDGHLPLFRYSGERYTPLSGFVSFRRWEQHKIGVGDDVVVCGMFLSRLGEVKNLPIVWSGVISAMPSEEIETVYGYHHVYLVEAHSTGGLSGSPVFAQMAPYRMIEDAKGTPIVKASLDVLPQYFMGMMLGHNSLTIPEENIEIVTGDRRTAYERKRDRLEYLIPLNTAIGVVLPHEYIKEAVTNPDLTQLRRSVNSGRVSDEPPDPAPQWPRQAH